MTCRGLQRVGSDASNFEDRSLLVMTSPAREIGKHHSPPRTLAPEGLQNFSISGAKQCFKSDSHTKIGKLRRPGPCVVPKHRLRPMLEISM